MIVSIYTYMVQIPAGGAKLVHAEGCRREVLEEVGRLRRLRWLDHNLVFEGLGFRLQAVGLRLQFSGFGVQGLGCRVWGLGFTV